MRARARRRRLLIAIGALVCSLAGAAPVTDVDGNGTGSAPRSAPVSATGTAPRDAVTATGAAGHGTRPVGAAPPPTSARLDLSPTVLKAAIAAADADYAPPNARGTAFGTSTSTPQTRIDRSFEAAQIERCGGDGTFKFDPPMIGPIGFGGLFAMPFLVHAMATGRCKL